MIHRPHSATRKKNLLFGGRDIILLKRRHTVPCAPLIQKIRKRKFFSKKKFSENLKCGKEWKRMEKNGNLRIRGEVGLTLLPQLFNAKLDDFPDKTTVGGV